MTDDSEKNLNDNLSLINGSNPFNSPSMEKFKQALSDLMWDNGKAILDDNSSSDLAKLISSILKRKVRPKDVALKLINAGKHAHLDVSIKFRVDRFVKTVSGKKAKISVVE